MFNLADLSLTDLAVASGRLRRLGVGARSFEEAADRVVRLLYGEFGSAGSTTPSCALVRLYKTHRSSLLPPGLRSFAEDAAGKALGPFSRCLVLAASAGVEPAWNGRDRSRGHKAIPLLSVESVRRLPMVAQLIQQLGFDVSALVADDPALLLAHDQQSFNVFHVPQAIGSPHIPAQDDFVRPYGIQSVLGFGGALPDGELFAVIVFARLTISRDTAEMFKPLSLATKLALINDTERPTFDDEVR